MYKRRWKKKCWMKNEQVRKLDQKDIKLKSVDKWNLVFFFIFFLCCPFILYVGWILRQFLSLLALSWMLKWMNDGRDIIYAGYKSKKWVKYRCSIKISVLNYFNYNIHDFRVKWCVKFVFFQWIFAMFLVKFKLNSYNLDKFLWNWMKG